MQTKETCRICGASMKDVLSLGDLIPIDFVADGEAVRDPAPLTLCECTDPTCGLVQLRHTLHRDTLFRNYWYLSSLNASMIASLKNVVDGVMSRVTLADGDVVIDIGANDGTLLGFYPKGTFRVGFDPANNLAEVARNNCDRFINDYFESSDNSLPLATVITSIAMFYDLDDPHAFVQKIQQSLRPTGIWVVQMTDLTRMLRANAFDNICHEHLCYYSLANFKKLIEGYGLEIFDVDFNDVNGASVRTYIGFAGHRPVSDNVTTALQDEAIYLDVDAIDHFAKRVADAKQKVLSFITAEINKDKRFHALGASTKGNTLLQYYDLSNHEIDVAADVNPSKHGRRMVGSDVPIVSQDESLAAHPDYYLVLPWHFMDFFVRKFEPYIAAGGALLAPLPVPRIYNADGTVDL